MLLSIEKLREWRNVPDSGYWSDEIIGHADAIEREVSERYIERDKVIEAPLDADGVVWKHTDNTFIDNDGYEHTLVSMKVDRAGKWILCSYSTCYQAGECRHVKPRTLTDVLADLFDRKMSITDAEHEISELLGGDEK